MEPASALQKPDAEIADENATSTSGVRTIELPSDRAGSAAPSVPGLRLRGIIVTPEPAPVPVQEGGNPPELEKFQVEFAYDTQFFGDLAGDVSHGGIIVTTYRDVPVGTAVHLDFELPNGVPVEARGEVRWVREDSAAGRRGLAIAFTRVSENTLNGISEYCRVHPPLFVDLE